MRRRLLGILPKLRAPVGPERPRPKPSVKHAVWSLLSAAAAILALAVVGELSHCRLIIGSFGASAVLLFGSPDSPLAQPRNLICGHLLSAAVGVAFALHGSGSAVYLALAVGTAILLMYSTHTLHPPGGATALIAVYDHQGWLFPLLPVGAGVLILLLVALFANNVVHHRQYPKHWW